jgi:hypothetical protein
VNIQPAIDCINTSCSSDPNAANYDGHLNQTTQCISANCITSFAPLYTGAQGCFDCIIYYLTSLQPIASAQGACTTDPHPHFAFLGQTPSMVLSSFPFANGGSNNKYYLLPATGFRRAVLKTQVVIDPAQNQVIDFFCAQLSSPLLDSDLPYSGYYGPKWEDEQDLQAKEAVAWIKSEADADGLPAIIAGDWHASPALSSGGDAGITTQSPEVVAMLDKAMGGKFTRADPPNYVPTCDLCPSTGSPGNAYNPPSEAPLEFLSTYLYNFPNNATQLEELWGTENSVTISPNPYEPSPPGNVGPLSPFFPRHVEVLRPPTK